MNLDNPKAFFDGTLDEAVAIVGALVEQPRAIFDDEDAPADGGGIVRSPGNWAKVYVPKSHLDLPVFGLEITRSADGSVYRVQQILNGGDTWELEAVANPRATSKRSGP